MTTDCTRGAQDVTGADIVRISRALALESWHFTQTAPAVADDPEGVVLDSGRRRVQLRLATAAHGCVFLVKTLSGQKRCGLGELSPASCRDAVNEDDRAHWLEVIRRWNSRSGKSSIEDFERYLLEAQCGREDESPWPEEVSA